MSKREYKFDFEVYNAINELTPADITLLEKAREATRLAYAPYSNFFVSAAARLVNGEVVMGTNQENASYPVGICSERVLLSVASSLFPGIAIDSMAISYKNNNGKSNRPVSPCGMCRQALVEYEGRTKHGIRLILSGMEGEVFVVERAGMLLPFSFGGQDLEA